MCDRYSGHDGVVIRITRRNRFVAAWLAYRGLRDLGTLPRRVCLRLALSNLIH